MKSGHAHPLCRVSAAGWPVSAWFFWRERHAPHAMAGWRYRKEGSGGAGEQATHPTIYTESRTRETRQMFHAVLNPNGGGGVVGSVGGGVGGGGGGVGVVGFHRGAARPTLGTGGGVGGAEWKWEGHHSGAGGTSGGTSGGDDAGGSIFRPTIITFGGCDIEIDSPVIALLSGTILLCAAVDAWVLPNFSIEYFACWPLSHSSFTDPKFYWRLVVR